MGLSRTAFLPSVGWPWEYGSPGAYGQVSERVLSIHKFSGYRFCSLYVFASLDLTSGNVMAWRRKQMHFGGKCCLGNDLWCVRGEH